VLVPRPGGKDSLRGSGGTFDLELRVFDDKSPDIVARPVHAKMSLYVSCANLLHDPQGVGMEVVVERQKGEKWKERMADIP
jgi:hypothetical protein